MTCPCRATEYALMESARRGKRIAELEECVLTAEERLEQMTRERDEARAKYQWMVDRACDEKLDGYRELGAKCAQLEVERDEVLKLLAAHEWVTDHRECYAFCLHCGREYNNGHADDCEVFGPQGFIAPEIRHV